MRVISGKYKSRPLVTSRGDDTRPTSDKIKESIFNWLTPIIHPEMVVLDYYGGSGGLAIEAISRGAKHAIICEKNKQSLIAIKRNIEMTNEMDRFTLLKGPNDKMIKKILRKKPDLQFDLVFLDPPYHLNVIQKDIANLLKWKAVHKNTYFICETTHQTILPPNIAEFELKREKKYGQTKIWLY